MKKVAGIPSFFKYLHGHSKVIPVSVIEGNSYHTMLESVRLKIRSPSSASPTGVKFRLKEQS